MCRDLDSCAENFRNTVFFQLNNHFEFFIFLADLSTFSAFIPGLSEGSAVDVPGEILPVAFGTLSNKDWNFFNSFQGFQAYRSYVVGSDERVSFQS